MPSSTSTTTVALTITCPTDTAWSTPIQMYISWAWLASGWNVWESCVSSKNVTVTSWDGSKTITMKWRDSASVPNETGVVSKSITFSTPITPTFQNLWDWYWVIWREDTVHTSWCRNDLNTTYKKEKCILRVTPGTSGLHNQPDNIIYIAPSDSIVNRTHDSATTWCTWPTCDYCNSLNTWKVYSNIWNWRVPNFNPEVYNLPSRNFLKFRLIKLDY